MQYEVGDRVIVAGQGPMEIIELPTPPKTTSIKLRRPNGYTYWANDEQIVQLVDVEYLRTYLAEYEARLGPHRRSEGLREWLSKAEKEANE